MKVTRKFRLVTILIALVVSTFAHNVSAAKIEQPKIRAASIYIVQDGDYLGALAIKHNTTVKDIMEANGIENPDKIYAGMELMIPGATMKNHVAKKKKKKIFVEVPKGVTLTKISKVYNVPIKSIVQANKKLTNPDNLRAGMKLFIPGALEEIELVPPPPCYKDAIEFYRVRNNITEKINLVYCNGKSNPKGVEQLSKLSAPVNLKEVPFPLHPRLAQMLQKIAEQYPGKRIEVISGQRIAKKRNHESYHNIGQAIDFRVQGISNRTLVNFVRKFKRCGVGFYPNSVFIHMDTREKDAFWIDYSKPGERPIYAKRGTTKKEIEKIRISRKQKTTTNVAKKSKIDKDHIKSKILKSLDVKAEENTTDIASASPNKA